MENIEKMDVINIDDNTLSFSIRKLSIHNTNLLLINYYKF